MKKVAQVGASALLSTGAGFGGNKLKDAITPTTTQPQQKPKPMNEIQQAFANSFAPPPMGISTPKVTQKGPLRKP